MAPPDAGMTAATGAAAYWDARFSAEGRLWGDAPSELARLAVARLRPSLPRPVGPAAGVTVLDVGCGYGRDARYLAAELGCRVLGVDPSPAAVTAARTARSRELDVEYRVGDAEGLAAEPGQAGAYDVVYACNVYHLLGPGARRGFAAALATLARPDGLLYLSTLSPRDPEHYAVGEPVTGEERSWVDTVYLHFCTAEELEADFAAFTVLDLEERSLAERLADGRTRLHASWFLEGRRR